MSAITVGFNADIVGSCSTLCGASGLAAVVAMFHEVYVGREYGKAVALGEIPGGFLVAGESMAKPHIPPGFTGCGSDGNAIGSYANPC